MTFISIVNTLRSYRVSRVKPSLLSLFSHPKLKYLTNATQAGDRSHRTLRIVSPPLCGYASVRIQWRVRAFLFHLEIYYIIYYETLILMILLKKLFIYK